MVESLESLIKIVSDEIYRNWNPTAPNRACPWCGQCCSGLCEREVARIMESGASRVTALAPDDSLKAVASIIDHTLLKPNASYSEVEKACGEARRFSFASVCIHPTFVRRAAELLRGSEVRVCTVVGFPLGATLPEVKAFEAEACIVNGAHEIDTVINLSALKSKDFSLVDQDIRLVISTAHSRSAICKVIIETAYLTDDEKIAACSLAKAAKADFVKTSTGFGPGGATVRDVALMRSIVGKEIGVKAAGGVRSWDEMQELLSAGASRIGTSASVKILHEFRSPDITNDDERPGNDYY